MQQAEDFREETRILAELLDPLPDATFQTVTQFKGWTIDDVLGHLHFFNHGARQCVADPADAASLIDSLKDKMASGASILDLQTEFLDGLSGRKLFAEWLTLSEDLADVYAAADPKTRIQWFGPSMSARSSITARQMEVWAHGQEVFDILGATRSESDRIRNIVILGLNAFGWTFTVHGVAVPEAMPQLCLIAPSGAEWEWRDTASSDRIEGLAVDFARVVTQTRNIADTGLSVQGPDATRWMAIAQCFAGGPEIPPPPGARHRVY